MRGQMITKEDSDTARALVVDDEPSMRSVLRHLLELEGWSVEEAEDGQTALELSQARPPDLILTDLEMPGMDGEELARRLRQEARLDGIPLVAISRRSPRPEAVELFDGILNKPVRRHDLEPWLTDAGGQADT
ncbi:MAG: response regulator [Gemmatimonadales bacterium]|nr:MAG: response regulator [Gemmatimonadales bacterium]